VVIQHHDDDDDDDKSLQVPQMHFSKTPAELL
jgi:hypothetical protein